MSDDMYSQWDTQHDQGDLGGYQRPRGSDADWDDQDEYYDDDNDDSFAQHCDFVYFTVQQFRSQRRDFITYLAEFIHSAEHSINTGVRQIGKQLECRCECSEFKCDGVAGPPSPEPPPATPASDGDGSRKHLHLWVYAEW